MTFIDLQGYFGDCCLTRGDLTNDDIAADLEWPLNVSSRTKTVSLVMSQKCTNSITTIGCHNERLYLLSCNRIRLEGCWARLVSDGWVSCCSRRWRVCWSQVQSPVSAVHTQTSRLLVCLSYWRLRLQNDTQHWWAHLSSCQRSTLRPCYSLITFLSWRWLSHVNLN